MIIRTHKDGTYSITGLTRDDISNLSFGACTAAGFFAGSIASGYRHASDPTWSAGWDAKRIALFQRLGAAFDATIAYPDPVRRQVLVSDDYGTTNPYEVAA